MPQERRSGLDSKRCSALFVLYEYMLSQNEDNAFEKHRILESIEQTAMNSLSFAKASYCDRGENYPSEILSPYLPYSLCQAAIAFHRLWVRSGHLVYKERLETLKAIIGEFTNRWMVACKQARSG